MSNVYLYNNNKNIIENLNNTNINYKERYLNNGGSNLITWKKFTKSNR